MNVMHRVVGGAWLGLLLEAAGPGLLFGVFLGGSGIAAPVGGVIVPLVILRYLLTDAHVRAAFRPGLAVDHAASSGASR
jgi:hypothetical protein